MLVGEVVFGDFAECIDRGEVEVAFFGEVEYGLAFCCGEEFALIVEEFEGVPLARIVGCGDDDAAVCSGHFDCEFGGRCGCEAALDYINAAADNGAAHQLLDHLSGQSRIPSHHEFVPAGCGWGCLCLGGFLGCVGAVGCRLCSLGGCGAFLGCCFCCCSGIGGPSESVRKRSAVRVCKFDNIHRSQALAGRSSDCSANSGNRFDKSHIW